MPPPAVGSDPSVVYSIRSTPEPEPSLALSETCVADVCQPAHEPPSQAMVVLGAAASRVTVKDVAAEVRPAAFVAVTSLGSAGSAADASKLYAPLVSVQPEASAGKP